MVRARILSGFDDPACRADAWSRLLGRGGTDVVFLTRQWLEPWWQTRGEGRLLLLAAERDGQVVALAPTYAADGTVLFLGAGESDYLDFIGDTSDPDVLPALLGAARDAVIGFSGFKFELVPARSHTGPRLRAAAGRLGFECFVKDEIQAFDIDLAANGDFVRRSTQRSMLKRELFFREHGPFDVRLMRNAGDVRPHFEDFFAQHAERWQGTDYESPFLRPRPRAWLRRVTEVTAAAGFLRVLRLDWRGCLLAMAFAWHYAGTHYCGPWSFAVEHGRHCPGHVLLRHSLLDALADELHTYDLRGGDDPYKSRFPTRSKSCATWCLYPA